MYYYDAVLFSIIPHEFIECQELPETTTKISKTRFQLFEIFIPISLALYENLFC